MKGDNQRTGSEIATLCNKQTQNMDRAQKRDKCWNNWRDQKCHGQNTWWTKETQKSLTKNYINVDEKLDGFDTDQKVEWKGSQVVQFTVEDQFAFRTVLKNKQTYSKKR